MPKKKNTKKTKKNKSKIVKTQVLANNVSPRPVKQRAPKKMPLASRMRHVSHACSVTNPFCPAAKNAKWPDGTTGYTLTEQFRGNIILSGTASLNQCFCFAAAAPFGLLGGATSATTTTCTMPANYITYKAASMLATYGGNYRIVSFGVIARCIASATAASGIMTMGTGAPLGGGTVVQLGTEQYSEIVIKAVQPGMELSWVSAPAGTGAHNFVPQSTSSGFTLIPPSWTSLTIELFGVPASAVINVEWFLNVEFQLAPNNPVLASVATKNPAKSAVVENLHSQVHTSVGSFIEGGMAQAEKVITDHAAAAFDAFISDPLSSIAMLFA